MTITIIFICHVSTIQSHNNVENHTRFVFTVPLLFADYREALLLALMVEFLAL